jgi:hypothetical protein
MQLWYVVRSLTPDKQSHPLAHGKQPMGLENKSNKENIELDYDMYTI